jgi:hypothetical protein
VVSQRGAGILFPVQATPQQLRHHFVDEIVQRTGKVRRLDHEAVETFGFEPFLKYRNPAVE